MNFGENLQNLRKQHHLSQEDLADKLDVSRQAISKWESGAGLPEMDKLIALSEIFQCKLDDLVHGSITTVTHVGLKDIYDKLMNKFSRWISLAISLILFGTVPLLGLADYGAPYVDYGVVAFLIFVAIATPIFVFQGIRLGNFKVKHPKLENFYTENELDIYNQKFTMLISGGVGIILVGLVVLMALITTNVFATESSIPIAIFMLFVAAGTPLFAYAGIQKSKFDIAHYNHENSTQYKTVSEKTGKICGVIMMLATIIFLCLGFIANLWVICWIVYPIAGIICGIVSTIFQQEA